MEGMSLKGVTSNWDCMLCSNPPVTGGQDTHTHYLEQFYSAASAAPCVLLLLASHIAESAGNKIEVIVVSPALLPMVPPVAARMKKKRTKTAAPAVPGAASDNAVDEG
jgi:hypothetical protein